MGKEDRLVIKFEISRRRVGGDYIETSAFNIKNEDERKHVEYYLKYLLKELENHGR